MPDPLNLFSGSKPDVYNISEIFDPDVHTTPALANGKVVPAVGSVVIDISVNGKITMWVVKSVSLSFKTTLGTPTFIGDGTSGEDRLVSYGNDTLILYFDDRGTPTRLIVDSKFVVLGSNSAEYRVTAIRDNVEVVLSTRLDTNGAVISDRIPLTDSGVAGVKKFGDCHCLLPITNGELVMIKIYDSAGVLTTEARMIARRADVLNDLLSENNPVVEFRARVDQTEGSKWVLYVNQNKADLTIYPELVFADGSKELAPIDNNRCFIYGMDDVNTTTANTEFPVMVKYFLGDDIPSTIAEGDAVRYLVLEKTIKIVARSAFKYSKISVYPRWDAGLNRYVLVFFGYYELRNRFEVLQASDIHYVGAAFDGTLFTTGNDPVQNLTLRASVVDSNGNLATFQQTVSIKLSYNTSATPYLISNTEDSELIYGDVNLPHKRPVIRYDAAQQKYFVPTSVFADSEAFLDNFYYRAEPPFLAPAETVAPAPTHFTVRNTGGQVILATPVSVVNFNQLMAFITSGGANQYNNSTVVVEFLKFNGTGYDILYGSVVAITSGTYNV
jgi:hypothetical protein